MVKTIRASALILLLACSAQAGYMQNDVAGTPPPQPQPTSAVREPTDAAQDPTLDGIIPNDAADSLTQTALDLLALLPSLL
jgi:hypothetical protein